MPEETTAYIPHNPGDLITSEDWNAMQIDVKNDLTSQVGRVQKALDDFKTAPVNADTFGRKTPEEWTKTYDERYFKRSDLKDGLGAYRRYFKQIDENDHLSSGDYRPVIINHKLGRYPLVNIYELTELQVKNKANDDGKVKDSNNNFVKFLLYYANRQDPVSDKMRVEGEDTVYLGDPIQLLLDQFSLSVTPNQVLVDVLNDLWDKMFDPGLAQDNFTNGSYGYSQYLHDTWIDKSVKELDEGGIWDNLQMAIRPQMIASYHGDVASPNSTGGSTMESRIQVYHLSQNVLEIMFKPASNQSTSIDLMVLLRT
jgi:hypothetical protein